MRPLGIVGVILIIAGVVVLAMRGVSYTKDRDSVKIGGVELSAENRGFVPPVAGIIAVVAGIVLVAADRRKA